MLGNGAALRLRPAATQGIAEIAAPAPVAAAPVRPDHSTARTVLASLGKPAFLRDGAGRLIFANAAYHDLARAMGRNSSDNQPAELFDAGLLQRNRAVQGDARKPQTTKVTLGEPGRFRRCRFPGQWRCRPGTCTRGRSRGRRKRGSRTSSAIIDALATPIAIFNANRGLVQFNRAYALLWGSIRSG